MKTLQLWFSEGVLPATVSSDCPDYCIFNSVTIEADRVYFDGALNLLEFYCNGSTLSVGSGEYWGIVCPSGAISIYNTDIADSWASGGAIFKSLLTDGNIDDGNNDGWIFFYTGYDEFRFSKIVRWTTNFIPPPYEYKLL